MKLNKNKKYNVGDKVTIISNLRERIITEDMEYLDAGLDPEMINYQDCQATITYCKGRSSGYYGIDLDRGTWSWSANMFKESYEDLEDNIIEPYVGMYLYYSTFLPNVEKNIGLLFQITSIDDKHIVTKYVDVNEIKRINLNSIKLEDLLSSSQHSDNLEIREDNGRKYLTRYLFIPDNEDLMKQFGVTNRTNNKEELKEGMLPIPNITEYSKIPIKNGSFNSKFGRYNGFFFDMSDKLAVTYNNTKKTLVSHPNPTSKYCSTINSLKYKQLILEWGSAKIKDFKASSELFGHTTRKNNMYQTCLVDKRKTFKINNVLFNYQKNDKYYHVLEINDGTLNLKMLWDDIELIMPNVNNYNLPKDRTIKKDSECKIIKDKLLPIKKGSKVKVLEVFNRSKPHVGTYDKNSYAKVLDLKTKKQFECKVKQLKVM